MTWTKLSDDFGDDCARAALSDAAFRTHVEALLWTMRRETDGHLDARDVRRFAETEDPGAAVQELVDAGFWRVSTGDGWQVVHHLEYQPETEVLLARRAAAADRQRRHRMKAAGVTPDDPSQPSRRDETRDTPRDATRDPGRDGSGRDGPGKPAPTRGGGDRATTDGESTTPTTEAVPGVVDSQRGDVYPVARSTPGTRAREAGASSSGAVSEGGYVSWGAEAEEVGELEAPPMVEDPPSEADALDLDDGGWPERVAVPGEGRRRGWVPS